jgi:ABC-type dipeptide/oligopeptide/nickel transport system permease subunit
MLREAQNFLAIRPSLAIFIGVAVSGVVLGLNLLGDALAEYYDSTRR